MTFNIKTLGCKVNTYESEYIYSLFIEKGFSYVEENADVYVVNSCTVTNMADRKSRQVINSLRRDNPGSVIVVCGCFSQNCYNTGKLDTINADIVIGNKDKSKIVDYVLEYLDNKERIERFFNLRGASFEDMEIKGAYDRTRAYVKIEDGCNAFCSYCVIPFTRGSVRSKNHESVIEEVISLVNNGYKEIVLTGIHTGKYNDGEYDFAALVRDLVKIKGLKRLRVSSIEINELTDEVLDVFKNSDVFVPHLHIPLQSGSDQVLKLMNRKYDKAYFEERINYIRSIKKDLSITTDVIVGFPGETDEMHKESMEFIKKIGFTKVHVFPYSDREGTVASKIKEKIDGNVKKERVKELLSISEELEKEFYNKYIGRDMEVLFEEEKEGFYTGHTANFIKVKTKEEHKSNELAMVKLTEENIEMAN